MLPVQRIIGHKDYAGPRKSDPVYDRGWRQQRVAAFTPRTAGASKPPTPTAPPEDDMPSAKEIVDELLTRQVPTKLPEDVGKTVSVLEVLTDTQLHARIAESNAAAGTAEQVWGAQLPDPDKDAREGTTGATSPARDFVVWGASAAYQSKQQIAAAVDAQDPAALAAAIRERFSDDLVADVAARLRVTPA